MIRKDVFVRYSKGMVVLRGFQEDETNQDQMNKPQWSELETKEKILWISLYSFVTASILILGAWLAQLFNIAVFG